MSSYKLTYFNGQGRAEVTRILFALGDIEYEDNRIPREQWMELKPNTPFGQLPILEVEGEVLSQGKAIEYLIAKRTGRMGKNDLEEAKCHMISDCTEDMLRPLFATFAEKDEEKKKEARANYCTKDLPGYFEKFEKMLEKNPSGFFVGNDITRPDISMYQLLSAMPAYDYITIDLSKFPKLAALVEKVKSNPKIAAWLAKRPVTAF